jgi:hypothetical protein
MNIFINYSLCELFISSQYGTGVLHKLCGITFILERLKNDILIFFESNFTIVNLLGKIKKKKTIFKELLSNLPSYLYLFFSSYLL